MTKKLITIFLKPILILFLILISNSLIIASEVGEEVRTSSGDFVFSIYIILEGNTMTRRKFKMTVIKSLDEVNLVSKNKFNYDPVKIKSMARYI